MPAGAASPTRAPSACRSIAARTGSTRRTSIRWRSSRRQPGSISIRRRRARSVRIGRRYARESETGGFSRRIGAREPRHPRCRARQGRRRLRAGAAEGSRRLAADDRIRARPLRLRQGPRARSRRSDFARAPERDIDAFCRQGFGALLAKLAAGSAGPARRRRSPRIDWRRNSRGGRDRARAASPRAPRSSRCRPACSPPARSSSRRICRKRQLDAVAQALARQLRSRRAGAAGQSAGAAERRPGVREIDRPAHRRDASPMCPARRSAWSRSPAASAASLRPRARTRWSTSRTDWLADLYGADVKKAVKRTHATRWNQRAVGARRILGRGARRAARAPQR